MVWYTIWAWVVRLSCHFYDDRSSSRREERMGGIGWGITMRMSVGGLRRWMWRRLGREARARISFSRLRSCENRRRITSSRVQSVNINSARRGNATNYNRRDTRSGRNTFVTDVSLYPTVSRSMSAPTSDSNECFQGSLTVAMSLTATTLGGMSIRADREAFGGSGDDRAVLKPKVSYDIQYPHPQPHSSLSSFNARRCELSIKSADPRLGNTQLYTDYFTIEFTPRACERNQNTSTTLDCHLPDRYSLAELAL